MVPSKQSAILTPMLEKAFRHTHRVTYSECTVGNHIYYSRYLDLLEEARGEFFRSVGLTFLDLQEQGFTFPVLEVRVSYKAAARYDDLIDISIQVGSLEKIRLTFLYEVRNRAGGLLVVAQTVHVCATLEGKPRRFPPELLERLLPFVGEPTSGDAPRPVSQ
jgi:acyl-CoA thioester hydrolase